MFLAVLTVLGPLLWVFAIYWAPVTNFKPEDDH